MKHYLKERETRRLDETTPRVDPTSRLVLTRVDHETLKQYYTNGTMKKFIKSSVCFLFNLFSSFNQNLLFLALWRQGINLLLQTTRINYKLKIKPRTILKPDNKTWQISQYTNYILSSLSFSFI